MKSKTNEAPAVLSDARERLARLIQARDEAKANVDKITEATARLRIVQDAPQPLISALSELDAVVASAMQEWSVAGGDVPKADVAQRDDLVRRIVEAQAQAAAAKSAQVVMEAEQVRDTNKMNALAAATSIAAMEVVLEQTVPLVDDYKIASKELRAKGRRLGFVLDLLDSASKAEAVDGPPHYRKMFAAYHEVIAELVKPFATDNELEARVSSEWGDMISRLQTSPTAKLQEA